jgi:hypothetical protein
MWPHCDGLDRGPNELDDPALSKEGLADWHGWADLLPPMIGLIPRRDFPRFNHPDESTFYKKTKKSRDLSLAHDKIFKLPFTGP